MKDFHSQVLEQTLQGEMDAHLAYEKNDISGNKTGNSRNGNFSKTIQTNHGESTIKKPKDRRGAFEPDIFLKHNSCGLSIKKLVV
jgi:transposase-like protein